MIIVTKIVHPSKILNDGLNLRSYEAKLSSLVPLFNTENSNFFRIYHLIMASFKTLKSLLIKTIVLLYEQSQPCNHFLCVKKPLSPNKKRTSSSDKVLSFNIVVV